MRQVSLEDFETLELRRQVFENNYEKVNVALIEAFGEYEENLDISKRSKNECILISTKFVERYDPEELLLKSSKSEGLFSDIFYENQGGFDFNIGLIPYVSTKFYTVEAKVKDYIFSIDYQMIFKKLLNLETKFEGIINYLLYRWCIKISSQNVEKVMNKFITIINKKDQRFNEDDKRELWSLVLSFTYVKGLEETTPNTFWKIKISTLTRTKDIGIFSINNDLKVQNVFISKPYRGLGVGKLIFEFELRKRPFTWTSTKNPAVFKILEKIGYRKVGIKTPFDFNTSGNKTINEKHILKNETVYIFENIEHPRYDQKNLKNIVYDNSSETDEYSFEIIKEIHPEFRLDDSGSVDRYSDLKLVDLYKFSKAEPGFMKETRYQNVEIILPVSDRWSFCQRKIDIRTGELVKIPTGVFELDSQWYFYQWDTTNNYLNYDFHTKIKPIDINILNNDKTLYLNYKKPNFNNFVSKLTKNEFIEDEDHFEKCLLQISDNSIDTNEMRIGKYITESRLILGKEAFIFFHNLNTDNEWEIEEINDKTIKLKNVKSESIKKDVGIEAIYNHYVTGAWNF